MYKPVAIKIALSLIVLLVWPEVAFGQDAEYDQMSNEIQFTRTINDKLATELTFNSDFSNTANESRILKTNIQRGIHAWAHYQYSPRWKFSSSLEFYNNKDVPDIGQYAAKEWRFGLQGNYYIKKVGYTLSTRARGEIRYLQQENGLYEDIYRYRQLLKLIQPLNAKVLRQGVVYMVASEEVILRSKQKETGMAHFDRNRFTFGGGYVFTDDLQLEVSYTNEFVPRDNGDQSYHILNLTLTINNFLPKVKKKLSEMRQTPPSDE